MRHHRLTLVIALALGLFSVARTTAQTPVRYSCRRPTHGSPAVQYRWYICWPDSNTVRYALTTSDTSAVIVHQMSGERVRVEGVDSLQRIGTRSVASDAWRLIIETGVPVPTAVALLPNFPNPFNPRTSIRFDLAGTARVRLTVYAIDGRLVDVLANAEFASGTHDVTWNGTDGRGRAVPSGVYICRLEAAGRSLTRSMILVR